MLLGTPEIVVILVVALLLFGPKNLPKLGDAFGKTVKSFRDNVDSSDKPKPTTEISEVVVEGGVEELSDASDHVFCSACGAQNPSSASFCSACGKKLNHTSK